MRRRFVDARRLPASRVRAWPADQAGSVARNIDLTQDGLPTDGRRSYREESQTKEAIMGNPAGVRRKKKEKRRKKHELRLAAKTSSGKK